MSAHIGTWTHHLAKFANRPGIRYLELGVYEGRSLVWMLKNVVNHTSSSAVGVDLFWGELLPRTKHNLMIEGLIDRAQLIKGRFDEVLPSLRRESFDLIYLDGGHMAWTTLETSTHAWRLLRKGGYLIFDDYEWNKIWPAQLTPKLAIDSFLKTNRHWVRVVHQGYQVIIEKIASACDLIDTYACIPIGPLAYFPASGRIIETSSGRSYQLAPTQIRSLDGALSLHGAARDAPEFSDRVLKTGQVQAILSKLGIAPLSH